MNIDYIPLLQLQRDLHGLPRDRARFRKYLNTIMKPDGTGVALPSLVLMNPMGKEHVTGRLDALLALDADGIAARAVAEASAHLEDEPGAFKAALVIADDLHGGWTNRCATDFTHRFGSDRTRFKSGKARELPQWSDHFWITGVLWSSEPASERGVREALLSAIYRAAYVGQNGPARTLRDMLAQEGHVLAAAGCAGPMLDEADIACTREILTPHLDADDMRTAIECLFGDVASRTLGFTPRGLSPCAGLALALHDAPQPLLPHNSKYGVG